MKHPDISKINEGPSRNEGWQKSLQNDTKFFNDT